jgi:hypothetical protein
MRYAIAALVIQLAGIANPAIADDGDLGIPSVTHPALARHAPTAEGFVPAGWRIESEKSGDLNGDGRADIVLVLRGNDPRNVIDARSQGGPEKFDTNPRILAVAFAAAAGGYELALENHTLIGRTIEPSAQDPLDPNGVQAGGVEIKRGTLRVTLGYFGGDMGHRTYTLRARNGLFELIGFDSVDVERGSGAMEEVSVNYATRRMKHSSGSISDDATRAAWTTLPSRPPLTVEEIGDGLAFQPPAN